MLSAAKGLMGKLWMLSPGLRVWLGVLIILNGVAPLWFLDHPEAWVAMATFHSGFLVGVVLFKIQGFTRLLGHDENGDEDHASELPGIRMPDPLGHGNQHVQRPFHVEDPDQWNRK